MLNLIKKDFSAGRYFLIGITLLIPIITTLSIWCMVEDFDGIIIGIFTILVFGLCVVSSFVFIGVDSAGQADVLCASLPIHRSTIVFARYVSSFMLTMGSYLLVILTCFISIHIFHLSDPAFDLILSTRGMTGMVSFMFLILSFIMPFVFKFGGSGINKALIVQIAIIVFIQLVKFLINLANGIWNFDIGFLKKLFNSILKWMIGLRAINAYLILFGFVCMVIYLSIVLSVRFYNRRDL